MLEVVRKWTARYFAHEEAVTILFLLLAATLAIIWMGHLLAPVIASVIIAFLLGGIVTRLTRYHVPRLLAVCIAFLVFIGSTMTVVLVVFPIAWRQLSNLFHDLPTMINKGRVFLSDLPPEYARWFGEEQLQQVLDLASKEISQLGQLVVSMSLSTIPDVVALMIFTILIPILVFFFLKDSEQIQAWLAGFLPDERPLMRKIWSEMNLQMANYVRGKVIEIIVVGVVSYIAFAAMGLRYAALLALSVGLSVVVPYIGAGLVTIPVMLIAYMQWGWGSTFLTLFFIYMLIQILDGNVLVPLLFSEAVDLHPIAIILAVLVFGGLWGLWGVFFAIPLATLIKALLNAWPRSDESAVAAAERMASDA